MEKQEMIDKIYEVVADKSLSRGCKVKIEEDGFNMEVILNSDNDNIYYYDIDNIVIDKRISKINGDEWGIKKIIGHPVLIGCVLRSVKEKLTTNGGIDINFRNEILTLWEKGNFEKPIEKQTEELIEFVYHLVC